MADGNPDASLYPQAPTPAAPIAPINMLAQIAQIQNARNQNTAFQQQQAYQAKIGGIMNASIDPTTGQPDYNKAFVAMSSDPDTARFAPEFFSQGLANQKIQADTAGTQLTNAKKRVDMIGDAAASLLPLGNNVTTQDLIGSGAQLIAMGVDPKAVLNYIKNAPQDGPPSVQVGSKLLTPLAAQIQQHALQAQGSSAAMGQVLGAIQTRNVGGAQQNVAVSPLMGTTTGVGPAVANTMTPGEANTGVPVMDGNGNPTVQPRAAVMPSVTGGGLGVQPQVTNPGLTPKTGLNPSESYVLDKYVPDLHDRAAQASTQLQNLQQMESLLPQFRAGGGSQVRTRMAQIGQALGVPQQTIDALQGGGSDGLAAAQEFEKIATVNAMNALRTASGQGHLSTSEYDSFRSALPNILTDPKASQDMLGYMQKLAQQPLLEQKYFNAYQKAGRPLAEWPAYWQSQLQATGRVKLALPKSLTQAPAGTPAAPADSDSTTTTGPAPAHGY